MIHANDCVKYRKHIYRVLGIKGRGAYTVACLQKGRGFLEVPVIQVRRVPKWMLWIEYMR